MAKSASELARAHTARAIAVAAEIMEDPFEEARDRLRAADLLIERGHGKAAQAVIAVPPSRALAAALAQMSDDELTEIINRDMPPARFLGRDVVEGTCVPVETDPLLR